MRAIALSLAILSVCLPAWSQTDGILQINDPIHGFLERQLALGHLEGAFLSHQPLSMYEARGYLDSLEVSRWDLSRSDRALLDRYRGVTAGPGAEWANGLWDALYQNGTDFASISGDGYGVQFNPLLYLSYGVAKQSARPDRDAYDGRVPEHARCAAVGTHRRSRLLRNPLRGEPGEAPGSGR